MKPAAIDKPSDTQVKVTRSFGAPVDQVWKSFTCADLVRRWMLGPPGWTMPICDMNFQVGGKYENVFRSEADGSQIAIVGVFREIEMFRKIVQDEKHAIGVSENNTNAAPEEHHTVVMLTFQETNGGTTVETVIDYGSRAVRDEALATGMEAAMEMGYRRIDELLIS